MPREVVLGVDFGSSSTIAGVLMGERIELVHDNGDTVIPSVVYVPDRGPPEVGRIALNKQLTEPQRVIRSVKRVVGLPSDAPIVKHYAGTAPFRVDTTGDRPVFKMRSGDLAPEQIVATILRRVRELGEARFGGRIEKMVMTMSAAAPAGYREAVVRAARVAQIQLLDVIAEPIAATLALDLHCQPANRRIVVCDFGGGTFDVSAVVQQGMRFTPVATAGDHYLGGDDLDDAMARRLAGHVFKSSRYDMTKDVVRWNELLMRCESAKRQLSNRADARVLMRGAFVQSGVTRDLDVTLDGPWVEGAWDEIFARVRGVVDDLLRSAGWTAQNVDLVGLVGGASLVPMFARTMCAGFGRDKVRFAHSPELAVAQGATILTARYAPTRSERIPVLVAAP